MEAEKAAVTELTEIPKASKPQRLSTLSSENTFAEAEGVKVDVGEFVLDDEAELVVKAMPDEEDENGEYKIKSFDISVGDLHELDDFITIRIPYDDSSCDEGEDPAKCVGAKYKNEETGEWEDVLFEVDAAAKELVIYTDHLSQYGAFYVKNAGRRDAYITGMIEGWNYITEEDAVAALKEMSENGGEAGQNIKSAGAKALQQAFGDTAEYEIGRAHV